MLTIAEYEDLWTAAPPRGFGKHIRDIPSYDRYIEREHMLADYIDIFRGFNSRGDRTVRPIAFPVELEQYPHPFGELIEQNLNPPSIRYILIAEAAPPRFPPVFKYDRRGLILGDTSNSYFYDVMAIKSTDYFTAPLTAFGILTVGRASSTRKRDMLYQLALKGVVLLDLFPFAIKYDRMLRLMLRNTFVLEHFYSAAAHYSLISRITSLTRLFSTIEPRRSALIAPPIISHAIADNISTHHGAYPWTNVPGFPLDVVLNHFGAAAALPYDAYYFGWPPGALLNGHYPQPATVNIVPKYWCCAYSGSRLVPHEMFIRNALHL